MNRSFWRERRVLVTGHTGFKGPWLCLWLRALGARVTGFALPPRGQPSLFELTGLSECVDSVFGDMRDSEAVRRVLHAAQPDVIVHLAAQSLVRTSYAAPVETFATNVMGTVHLLDAVRDVPCVRAILIVTSDKCYAPNDGRRGFTEEDPIGGLDPYSSSKGCAELVTAAYRASFFAEDEPTVAVATARAGNVIGGGDWSTDRLVPDLIRAFSCGSSVSIRYPDAVRPWQHVLEPLAGYLQLIERLRTAPAQFASAWNFGPTDQAEQPVSVIADGIAARWGGASQWHRDTTIQPRETQRLVLDSSRSCRLIGWTPQLSIDTALDWTVAWYQRAQLGENASEITLSQIRAYEERLAS